MFFKITLNYRLLLVDSGIIVYNTIYNIYKSDANSI